MKLQICDNLSDWNKSLASLSKLEFIQSWGWGDFQNSIGNKVFRILINNQSIQGFEQRIGLGKKFLYLPRVDVSDLELSSLGEYFKNKNYLFLRIEPLLNLRPNSYLSAGKVDKLKPINNRQPKQTLILDINQTEEEILNHMHPKTRYNIHLAERKGIVIKQEKNAGIFWKLNLDTTERDGFKSHSRKYYEKMLEQENIHQLIAFYNNEPIASIILVVNNKMITYLHGVSANKFRNLMAPYLLQWRGMLLGKKLGCVFYDFWGVAPMISNNDNKIQTSCFNGFCWPVNHPWSGVTRFKVGFGGEYREYPEAMEIPLKKWQYKLFNLFKKLRG